MELRIPFSLKSLQKSCKKGPYVGRLEADPKKLNERIGAYISEFEEHGTDNILLDI
jgi:hypothetical protein